MNSNSFQIPTLTTFTFPVSPPASVNFSLPQQRNWSAIDPRSFSQPTNFDFRLPSPDVFRNANINSFFSPTDTFSFPIAPTSQSFALKLSSPDVFRNAVTPKNSSIGSSFPSGLRVTSTQRTDPFAFSIAFQNLLPVNAEIQTSNFQIFERTLPRFANEGLIPNFYCLRSLAKMGHHNLRFSPDRPFFTESDRMFFLNPEFSLRTGNADRLAMRTFHFETTFTTNPLRPRGTTDQIAPSLPAQNAQSGAMVPFTKRSASLIEPSSRESSSIDLPARANNPVKVFQELQSAAAFIGLSDMDISLRERHQIIDRVEESQTKTNLNRENSARPMIVSLPVEITAQLTHEFYKTFYAPLASTLAYLSPSDSSFLLAGSQSWNETRMWNERQSIDRFFGTHIADLEINQTKSAFFGLRFTLCELPTPAMGLKGILINQFRADILGKIELYVGQNARLFRNTHGDLLIESNDGLRQLRLDLNHFSPHKNPHIHLVKFKIKNGSKVEIANERIFPIDANPE